MVRRKLQQHCCACGMPDTERRDHVERQEQRAYGERHAFERELVCRGSGGEAVARQVEGDDVRNGREQREHLAPCMRGTGGAVDQYDGRSATGALHMPAQPGRGDEG